MDFQEAEARFRWVEGEHAAGRMDERTYRDALNGLRVVDAWGRHWMLQERTGVWHVYDGRQWVPAAPPVQPAYPPAPPAQPAYQPPGQPAYAPIAPQPAPAQAQSGGTSCFKVLLYLALWAVIWVVIAAAVYFLAAREQPAVLLGVGVAAVLSGVLMLFSLAGSWQGQIVDLRTERVTVTDSDGDTRHEMHTFAYIRQPNGRIRRERAMTDWRVGDRLEKRRGEAYVRVVR